VNVRSPHVVAALVVSGAVHAAGRYVTAHLNLSSRIAADLRPARTFDGLCPALAPALSNAWSANGLNEIAAV
jgi:hypothetical protein